MSRKEQKGRVMRVKWERNEGVEGIGGKAKTRHAMIWREGYFRQRKTGRLSSCEIRD